MIDLRTSFVAAVLLVLCVACGPTEQERQAQRERLERDRNTAAYKAGKMARQVAKEGGKLAVEANRKLEEAARKAKEGWDQQSREERAKPHRDDR